jgi:hypothetical protein
MPPQRTPLGSISGNRPKGSEISPYMRRQVKGQAKRGALQQDIAKDLKLTTSTRAPIESNRIEFLIIRFDHFESNFYISSIRSNSCDLNHVCYMEYNRKIF